MDQKIKELLEQLMTKKQEAEALLGKGTEITAEDVERVKAINAEVGEIQAQLATFKDAQTLAGSFSALDASLTAPSLPMRGAGDAGAGW